MPDALGRDVLPTGAKSQIASALADIPAGKRGALILFANQDGATAHLAANLNGTWKIAAGGGVPWHGDKPSAWVGVEASW